MSEGMYTEKKIACHNKAEIGKNRSKLKEIIKMEQRSRVRRINE